MTDRNTSRAMDVVPEADLAEQSVPAYPDEIVDETDEQEIAAAVDRDALSADPADIVEQLIAVPLEDDHDTGPAY
ncbi:hypothetical protein [Nocardia sp. NBC_01009]|uniref:hypothetical protein n=1 Tax=unclassified Nocardia TaxID=2637762 RepID=UPI003865A5D1|nr:hypothetical protein OHA42_00610 [Nocardia sp. NBC_01009]